MRSFLFSEKALSRESRLLHDVFIFLNINLHFPCSSPEVTTSNASQQTGKQREKHAENNNVAPGHLSSALTKSSIYAATPELNPWVLPPTPHMSSLFTDRRNPYPFNKHDNQCFQYVYSVFLKNNSLSFQSCRNVSMINNALRTHQCCQDTKNSFFVLPYIAAFKTYWFWPEWNNTTTTQPRHHINAIKNKTKHHSLEFIHLVDPWSYFSTTGSVTTFDVCAYCTCVSPHSRDRRSQPRSTRNVSF